MTSRLALIKLLVASQGRVPGATSAAEHLRTVSMDEIPHARTATGELLHVQSRRLRSSPEDVHGLDGLVAALRETDAEEVDLYALAEGGRVTSVALTVSGRLLGCVVGPDRREARGGDRGCE